MIMRIAYICADAGIPVFGEKGCSIHVQEVIRSMVKQGAEVCLFTPRLEGVIPEDLDKKIEVCLLPAIPKSELDVREKKALFINDQLESFLEKYLPFDLIYERYSLWSYKGMEYANKNNIPSILEVNSPLIEEQEKHRGLIHKKEAENVANKVFNFADNIVAVSDGIKNYLSKYIENNHKIQVISNGVNTERFSSPLIFKNSVFTVGFVGTLKPWHGLDILLEGFEYFYHSHPQSRLLIVGDGTQKEQLLTDIKSKNLEPVVELTGAVSPSKIPSFLAQMDVGVAPYPPLKDFYFSPLKVYEYMAAGLPVIVSDIGQLTKVINHGINGFLSPAGDAMALANYLEELWRSPVLRQTMGNQAHDYVLKNHTWDQVVEKTLNLAKIMT